VKTWLRWTAFALALVVCLGTAYDAYTLAGYSWNQVVDYRGPYAKVKLPGVRDRSPAGYSRPLRYLPWRGPRLVYVIVDGLREDVSRKMPTINALRARGYDAVVRTAQPSLSFPNWTTLLSGAPQRISGVTTNWFEEHVPVETLVDVALAESRTVAVSAPTDFEMLYGVKRSPYVFLRDWEAGTYMSAGIVDNAIRLAQESSATLVVVHLPDIDEAGHASGGASKEYLDTAMKVDADLHRLVVALQGERVTFVVASDHGHIDTGGHGGPEDVVTKVPAVFAGWGVNAGAGEGSQDQVASTVARLNQLPPLPHATGAPLDVGPTPFIDEQLAAFNAYTAAVTGAPATATEPARARAAFDAATGARLARERWERLPVAAAVALAALLAIVAVGLLSWRALVSALVGTVFYYLFYDGLYFLAHGFRWSLSSFNSEDLLKPFMNGRMIEAVIAGVLAAAVAADIYLVTRKVPRRPTGEYLPGWLALGTATVLVIQATLAIQVAWYLWYWGAAVSWYIPDLALGFKYDLDLIQLTALGGAALLAPVVTYLVGRYHPIRQPKPAADPADATAA
jgi:hypothetical protein